MTNCFELWIDKCLPKNIHESIGASLWSVYENEIDVLIRTFTPGELDTKSPDELPANLLLLSSKEIPAKLILDSSNIVLIESNDDFYKLAENCCCITLLRTTIESNDIYFGKTCDLDSGECIPGVLCKSVVEDESAADPDVSDPPNSD